jgi:uncharacterized protein YjbI with pentapeptide repeats
VILTCRTSYFKDKADLERLKGGRDLHSLLHKHQSYQVIFLEGLTPEQQQHYLSCYYSDSWVEFSHEIEKQARFRSLAERPILLNMIVNTISGVKNIANINVTQLYEMYTDIWIKRDNWRCHLTPDQRSNVSKALAFELVRQHSPTIHHKELQKRVENYFAGSITTDVLDQYAHEVRTCTFLKNDMQGFYAFAHRSFAEFFAAKYLLDQIMRGNIDALKEPYSLETLSFLGELINNRRDEYLMYIWDILRPSTESQEFDKRPVEIALYILLQCKENLSSANLSDVTFPDGAILADAQLAEANCIGLRGSGLCFDRVDFNKACLKKSILTRTSFSKAILTTADFEGADLSESDLSSADLRCANFCRATLRSVKITPMDVFEARKKNILERIAVEGKRMKEIRNIGALIKAIVAEKRDNAQSRKGRLDLRAEKRKKPKCEALLKAVANWKPEDEIDELINSSISLEREILEGFGLIEATYERRMTELEEKLKKSIYVDIFNEQKKRNLRQKHKEYILAKEYVRQQIKVLIEHAYLYDALGRDKQYTDNIIGPQVKGATFIDAIGLSLQQTEWLRQSGAILRLNKQT